MVDILGLQRTLLYCRSHIQSLACDETCSLEIMHVACCAATLALDVVGCSAAKRRFGVFEMDMSSVQNVLQSHHRYFTLILSIKTSDP